MELSQAIEKLLFRVSKPARYTGGEYGSVVKEEAGNLQVAISYPDLYEIGMSNTAVKLIYNILNSLEGVTCERIFAPAPDMEEQLRCNTIPLFSLETKKPLAAFDIAAFSLGYELTATNLLAILDLGRVPILREQRGPEDPIILTGGPAVTNPLPFSAFIDFAFVGEAEDFLTTLFPRLAAGKKQGASRQDLCALLLSHPAVWSPEQKTKPVKKAVFSGFSAAAARTYHPVANLRLVQDHGTVEIMRGCPNGCRFCHAGMLYRPLRIKQPACIAQEIGWQVFRSGYREITLSSLSTGDYPYLDELTLLLNRKYKSRGVSFALPSLRINSLSLDILESISLVRKSGLTFAVETPEADWQLGLNKQVSMERTIQLLAMAEQRGWRLAKFYFMIGLPLYDADESDHIIHFLKSIRKHTRMNLNINISTFVPKAHTPFQWAAQLDEGEAMRRIQKIRHSVRGRGFKIGYHSPFASCLEGILARGDEQVCGVILDAYKQGARLDAWEEYLNRKLWREVITAYADFLPGDVHRARDLDKPLPWDNIDTGVKKTYLAEEYKQALAFQTTPPCSPDCAVHCGVCRGKKKIENRVDLESLLAMEQETGNPPAGEEGTPTRLLVCFSKQGLAVYLSHLNTMSIFEKAFIRAGYAVRFTEGFNPKPRIEFANPLALGIASTGELLLVEVKNFDAEASFRYKLTAALPGGYCINRVKILQPYRRGEKKTSLANLFWGSDFHITMPGEDDHRQVIFQKLAEQSRGDFAGALAALCVKDQCLSIRWKKVEKKGYNIIHFLETVLAQNPFFAGIRITRLATLARDLKQQPAFYFDVME